jgi:RimJ/RimL family protein N-acetyltransferase
MSVLASSAIPILETERTVLRGFQHRDLDAHFAMWADSGVTRFIGGRPMTREEAWGRYLRYAGLWVVLGYGFWAVEEKSSSRLIGNAGFHDLHRDIFPSIDGLPEAAWALVPEAHGRGLATEIVTAMHRWSDVHLEASRTVCIVDPDNAASLRVALKCGYQEQLRTVYHDRPTILLQRPRRPAPF